MIERIRELTSSGLRGAAGRLPAQTLRPVQVARWMLRTLADAIEPLRVPPAPHVSAPPAAAPRSQPSAAPPPQPGAAPPTPAAAPSSAVAAPSAPTAPSPSPLELTRKPGNGQAAPGAAQAPRFHKAARLSELTPGSAMMVELAGRTLALYNVDGKLYATDGKCLHRGGPVGEGELEGCVVTCPWHGWRYDVTTGQCETNPGARLGCYRVRLEGEDIQIEV